MKTYKEYMDRVDDELAIQGIGKGTFLYKNTNREVIANTLALIDLMNLLSQSDSEKIKEVKKGSVKK